MVPGKTQVWMVACCFTIVLAAAVDIVTWVMDRWGISEINNVYRVVGLLKFCNGTRRYVSEGLNINYKDGNCYGFRELNRRKSDPPLFKYNHVLSQYILTFVHQILEQSIQNRNLETYSLFVSCI